MTGTEKNCDSIKLTDTQEENKHARILHHEVTARVMVLEPISEKTLAKGQVNGEGIAMSRRKKRLEDKAYCPQLPILSTWLRNQSGSGQSFTKEASSGVTS